LNDLKIVSKSSFLGAQKIINYKKRIIPESNKSFG